MIFLHWFLLSDEIFGFEQTLPLTDVTEMFIRNAMKRAKPLSSRKYLLALCQNGGGKQGSTAISSVSSHRVDSTDSSIDSMIR